MSWLLRYLTRWLHDRRPARKNRTAHPLLESLEQRQVPTVTVAAPVAAADAPVVVAGPNLPVTAAPAQANLQAATALETAAGKDDKLVAPVIAAQVSSVVESARGPGRDLSGQRSVESHHSVSTLAVPPQQAFFSSPFLGRLHFWSGGHGGHHQGAGRHGPS